MSAPNPRICTVGTLDAAPEFDFDELAGPAESAELEFDLVNDSATAETMTEVSIGCQESDDGGVTWYEGTDNTSVTFLRMLHVQAIDQDGDGITPQTTGYTPTGVGARLYLDPIPAECRRTCRMKLVVPAGNSTASKKIKIIPRWFESVTPLSQGLYEAGIHGVVGGAGDPTYSALLYFYGLAAEASSNNLQVGDYAAKVAGVPWVKYAHNVELLPSASGMARWIALNVGADGSVETVSSAEVTAPAPLGDRPPKVEPFLGYVMRGDGDIELGEIYVDEVTQQPFWLNAGGGVDGSLGPGAAIVDDRRIRKSQSSEFTAIDDADNVVYLQPDGSVTAVEAGDLPAWPRAEPMWAFTLASGVISNIRDLRRPLGPPTVTFAAHFPGSAVVDDAVYLTSSYEKRWYVKLMKGAQISARTVGDRTTGDLVADLEYSTDGTTWTTFFDNADYVPQFAAGETNLVSGGWLPSVTVVEPGTLLRWRIAEIPVTGGSVDPQDVQASIDFEEAPT